MALLRRINQKAKKQTKNNWFRVQMRIVMAGALSIKMAQPILKAGMHVLHRISWYHTMIDMPVWRFMFIILSSLELIYFASTLLWNRYRAP
jgi:inward rectifier potassium channel